MPNPYFEFKEFTVRHNLCAMKVGTDGVLLGLWADARNAKRVLDVGSGSGLIALMLAQRNSGATIDAIDIDTDAVRQTKINAEASPWYGRICCHLSSLQDYAKVCSVKYDAIVSNPPFFNQSLKAANEKRTLARHSDSLYMEEVIEISSGLLREGGRLSLIYPHQEKENLIELALKNGLFVSRITNVYPTPTSEPKRVLIELSKAVEDTVENDLVIEISRHVYSPDFVNLAKEFYLRM